MSFNVFRDSTQVTSFFKFIFLMSLLTSRVSLSQPMGKRIFQLKIEQATSHRQEIHGLPNETLMSKDQPVCSQIFCIYYGGRDLV